jgi:FtsH-binding integral membrane protein
MASQLDSVLNAFQFGKLEKPVKVHLKNVYATMGLALLVCAVGGIFEMFSGIPIAGLLSTLGGLGVMIWLLMTPHSAGAVPLRFSLLMAFSFLSGLNLGPYLNYVVSVDPSIVPTAFLGTSLIFVCFSLAALLTDDRKYLALGGTLMSGLTWMMCLSLLYLFTGSTLILQVHIYLGLAVMCGFVLYDTQVIVEKRRQGNDDFIVHTLDLFIDFISIFRRLLVILTDKKDKRRRD